MTISADTRKYLALICMFCVALVLSACDAPRLEPIGSDATILAFGDSLTAGVGVSEQNSYPAVLAELTGLKVVNAGVSGETTDRGLARLPQLLDDVEPDLLLLIEGGNDILRNQQAAAIKWNLGQMIGLAKQRGIPVVLLGVPEKKLFSDAAPLYAELAEEHGLVYDGSLIADLLRSPDLKSDQIHFNEKGYRTMAESIYALLESNGALR